ncbi:MAG: phenylalanine--tRNA ligase subunit beta [Proteobacteria bacterium]|nr:phenylalanine--tRNA ligase subunit beta [Pseudomonadota bacterium]
MLVSLRWLRDYVDVELKPGELADRLTMAGLEVESVDEAGPEFTNVVVAKILSIKSHPGADKLSLCEVTTGDENYPVVCGAKNINVGDVVPLAQVGATIPGGYTIKSSIIRGEKSEGMLCSEDELGIGEDAAGIMILPGGLSLGEDLADALDLKDTVFDIGITPNRSDCLSVIGIAREVAAITGKKLKLPEIVFTEAEENTKDITSVDILNPNLCPRYTARIIKDVRVGPSPHWMRLRLEAVGLRAINNIVDITNFVMMEFGQPLHAFDFRFLEEGRIVVRGAQEGEEFVSLDGKERILKADTLMICDGVKPVAIGGIMGGMNSEVTDDTGTVLLESAYFNPTSIRKTSKWLGMSTDASFRFERGVDPEGVVRASNRTAQLIADLAGGKICRNCIDQYSRKIKPVENIPLRVKKVDEVLGVKVKAGEIKKILKSLGMVVNKTEDGSYLVTPPTFRVDISREIDLIEEIIRIHGYDGVPMSLPAVPERTDIKNREKTLEEKIRVILTGQGYSEVINYSFIMPESANILGLKEDDEGRKFVMIKNPLTEDQSVMRTSLVYGLLDTMRKNANAGCFDLRIFEKGKIFIAQKEGELPLEKEKIAGLITGIRYDDLWHWKELLSDFYDLKGCVENLFDGLMVRDVKFKSGTDVPLLHPGKSCGIFVDDKKIGFIGEVHPGVLEKMDLKRNAVVFELDFDFLAMHYTEEIFYREIPRFPISSRDVAFLVGKDMEGERILDLVVGESEELLEKAAIFDVYYGKGIPEGMKSTALRFTYRSSDRTLTDDEVDEAHNRIVERIAGLTGARIRGKED